MTTEEFSFSTAGGETTAYVAMPQTESNKVVMLIQEWWGLNDHIKDIAGRYAAEGFIAVAPDLYRGKIAADPTEAAELMNALELADGVDTIENARKTACERFGVDNVAITGYCMGGTFSLRAACLLDGIAAAAPFYGDIPEDEVLQKLAAPTIFIAGEKDEWINPEKVATLENAAIAFDLPVEVITYNADHAFFNDTRPEVYDADAAKDAWSKVVELFNRNLK